MSAGSKMSGGEMPTVGLGIYWNDVEVGQKFKTIGRTLTEPDLVNFISTTGMVEEMFTNLEFINEHSPMGARPCPGSMVFCFAEALVMQATMQRTGMAFLGTELTVNKPTTVGDTIHVECEVTEIRPTSKPGRGLMRTQNKIVNQRGEVVITYSPLRMVKTRPV